MTMALLFLILAAIMWSGLVLVIRWRLQRLEARGGAASGLDPVIRLCVSLGAAVTLVLFVSLRWLTAG